MGWKPELTRVVLARRQNTDLLKVCDVDYQLCMYFCDLSWPNTCKTQGFSLIGFPEDVIIARSDTRAHTELKMGRLKTNGSTNCTFQYQVPGTRYLVPGALYQVPLYVYSWKLPVEFMLFDLR